MKMRSYKVERVACLSGKSVKHLKHCFIMGINILSQHLKHLTRAMEPTSCPLQVIIRIKYLAQRKAPLWESHCHKSAASLQQE